MQSMAENTGLLGYTEEVETVVVKRCLISSLSRSLDPNVRIKFLEYIDSSTEFASRLIRRASLVFLYFVVRHQEDDGPRLLDFGHVQDAYWKSWLRIGLDCYDCEYPNALPKPGTTPEELQTQESKILTAKIYAEIPALFGTTLGDDDVSEIPPKYFDRVLGHLATQFKTAVCNAQTVNFLTKFKRLCRYKARENNLRAFDVLRGVLRNDPLPTWPDDLKQFVVDARAELGLASSPRKIVYEDTKFSFPTRFHFHWWMQQEFAALGQKKLMLAPVFKVQRTHIRLDATHLCYLVGDFFTGPEVMKDLRDKIVKEEPVREKPTEKTQDFKIEMQLHKWSLERHEEQMKRYKAAKERLQRKHPLCRMLQIDMPSNPEVKLSSEIPIPAVKRPEGMTDEAWVEVSKAQEAAKDTANASRQAMRERDDFKAGLAAYHAYEDQVHSYALKLFGDFGDRNPKKGWKPSGSIVTDGVSISICYERVVRKPVLTCEEARTRAKAQAAERKKASETKRELDPFDDYDPYANTCVGDALVLGVDPGRTSIVTIVCVDHEGRRHVWRLSRGRYYNDAGILAQNRLQQVRYSVLQAGFATLTAEGGALRASQSSEIAAYVRAYRVFEQAWWRDVALKRRESRDKFQRFVGKQRAMSRFFTGVRKDAEALKGPEQTRIEVAYGAVGPTMASSGKGEMAVPTKGAYAACCQAFMKERESDRTTRNIVSLEDENNTSAKCWQTGGTYEKVYKTFDPVTAKEYLCHTAAKRPPSVPQSDVALTAFVRMMREKNKEKAKKRRGGVIAPQAPETVVGEEEKTNLRHIDVRGLRFCPERRMYYDRDKASAEAIAGLRCIKLRGLGRPTAFRIRKLSDPR